MIPTRIASTVLFPLVLACACCDVRAALANPQEPQPVTSPPAAPVAESAPVGSGNNVDVELFSSAGLVVPLAPSDEEPLEVLPDLEELADITGLDAEPERVQLGRMLFHDTRLSHDFTISCATCHDLRFGGIDRHARAVGIHGQVGPVNTPTVFNAALQVSQFWDGRAGDLQSQAAGPPQAAGEMGSNFAEIVGRIRQDGAYARQFQKAFPDRAKGAKQIDQELILEAIATFELTLITPDSPFDQWLGGDAKALDARALRGYALFKEVGCSECHYGPAVGGKAYQKLGRKIAYFGGKSTSHADMGRLNVTKDERDRHSFKVPTLRNIAATAPYFHDGSVTTLAEAVELMARHQLGLELAPRDRDDMVVFLRSLTGIYEGRAIFTPKESSTVSKSQGTSVEAR